MSLKMSAVVLGKASVLGQLEFSSLWNGSAPLAASGDGVDLVSHQLPALAPLSSSRVHHPAGFQVWSKRSPKRAPPACRKLDFTPPSGSEDAALTLSVSAWGKCDAQRATFTSSRGSEACSIASSGTLELSAAFAIACRCFVLRTWSPISSQLVIFSQHFSHQNNVVDGQPRSCCCINGLRTPSCSQRSMSQTPLASPNARRLAHEEGCIGS